MDILGQILQTIAEQSGWETCAVVLALAYLLLATQENILCWYCALGAASIFTILFWHNALPMQSALNIYYAGMAVYGWYQWRYGGQRHAGVVIHTLPVRRHLLILSLVLLLTLPSGYLIDRYTEHAWPYIDAFVAWGGVISTYMVAKKFLENWLYWLLLDSICIPLYYSSGLQLTALLFAIYLFISVYGYFSWRSLYRQQTI